LNIQRWKSCFHNSTSQNLENLVKHNTTTDFKGPWKSYRKHKSNRKHQQVESKNKVGNTDSEKADKLGLEN